MDVSIIRGIIAVFEWMGINLQPYDALLLIGIAFVCGVFVTLAKFNTRINMHADHFDELDKQRAEARRDTSKALENSGYAKGCVDTLIKFAGMKKKP